MLIRREGGGDIEVVRAIVSAAFALPDTPESVPVEVTLLDRLRADKSWLPALSLVAAEPLSGEVVGHVVCTRATIDARPVLGLGPLAVRPDWQRRGVGTALMHGVLAAAEALNEPLIGLVGDPNYYGRFGFRAASQYGIILPNREWEKYFQVRTLSAYRPLMGTFVYAGPFNQL